MIAAAEHSGGAVRILVIDDDEDDYLLARGVLGSIRSFRSDLHWESTYESGLAALRGRGTDVCLLDYRLGARSGLDLLADAREGGCGIPIIFLTGKSELDTDDLAMQCGADDFIAKAELTPAMLERSIRYAVERSRHIEQLRRSEQHYRRIVEATAEGVWLTDAEGLTTFVNPQMVAMLGWPRDEIIGEARAKYLGDVDERALGVVHREVLLQRKDGSDLWAWVRSQRLYDVDGRCEGALAMVSDVTERRRAEAVLRNTEEQLRQSQKMEAIGALAGGIAHDFNNLLSVILSYSEVVRHDLRTEDPMRADLLEIERAGHRATELTAQLLAFGRKQMLKPRVVDVNEVIGGIEKMLRRLLRENIELTILADSSGLVFVDPSQIEQIILNLAVNAADAMPDGGRLMVETSDVTLTDDYAAAHVGVTPGLHVLLAVSDTGVGIPKDIQGRVFEPFFTTKEKGKGTGLGLATVFGIVKQSGGHIWLYSEPGSGTTFKIFFPVVAGQVARSPSAPELSTTGGTETVLLVEDNDMVRKLVCNVLQRGGYTVLEAGTPADALLVGAQFTGKIDLLLTDVVMPIMSGPEVAERLKKLRTGIGVLFMSGYTDNAIVHNGLLDSGINFLQKPVTPGALLAKLREVLDANKADE